MTRARALRTREDIEPGHGVLTEWRDERGFGFITPAAGGPRVFVHVSEFPRGHRPVVGCKVNYAVIRDGRNRLRAAQVRDERGPASHTRLSRTSASLAVAALFFLLLAGLLLWWELPVTMVVVYGLVSLVTFAIYGADKSAAKRGEWRTSESTLHTLALVGGWPGALVARHLFRHKTTKQPFRTIFWGTVVANCGFLGWIVLSGPLPLP